MEATLEVAEEPAVLVLDDRGTVVHASLGGAAGELTNLLVGEAFTELVDAGARARLAALVDLARHDRSVRSLGEVDLHLPGGVRQRARWLVDGRAPLRDGAVLVIGHWAPSSEASPDPSGTGPVAARNGSDVELHVAPVVDLATGGLAGVDASLRRNDPARGLVNVLDEVDPGADPGRMVELGERLIVQACALAADWQLHGWFARQQVNVALRAEQIPSSGLADVVRSALRASGVRAASVCMGVPEAAVAAADPRFARELDRVAGLGVHLALHDLGSGDSALLALHRLPLDVLRLPRALVQDTDPRQPALVAGLVDLAHGLGLRVLAEGVETEQQASAVRAAGCDAAFGYLFGGAVPAAELAAGWS